VEIACVITFGLAPSIEGLTKIARLAMFVCFDDWAF
jgi:hypothetical protein